MTILDLVRYYKRWGLSWVVIMKDFPGTLGMDTIAVVVAGKLSITGGKCCDW